MDGYELSATGTLVKVGATILEKGTRVWIAESIYTGSVVGGDFCGGTSYVVEVDSTGDAGLSTRRGRYAAEKLLAGDLAIEKLCERAAAANAEERVQFVACIARLGDDAETARAAGRAGAYRLRYE